MGKDQRHCETCEESEEEDERCWESCDFCCGQSEVGESEGGGEEQAVIWLF